MSTVTVSPEVGSSDVVFRVADPGGDLAGVNLYQEVQRPRIGPAFTQDRDRAWRLRFPRAEIDRMEYMLELARADGTVELTPDPANRLRAPGPFGDKSVVEWPEYGAPEWLEGSFENPGTIVHGSVDCRPLKASLSTPSSPNSSCCSTARPPRVCSPECEPRWSDRS
jgi:hypothetical protein